MSSRGVNKVILVGNLGQDPEVRYIPNGSAVATLSLATSESWRDKQSGEQKEVTEWHRVVIFGKLAEIAGEYLRKGSQVYIEGQLRTRKWTDQAGQDKYTTEVVVNIGGTMQMLGGRQSGSPAAVRIRLPGMTGASLINLPDRLTVARLPAAVPVRHRWTSMTIYRSLDSGMEYQNRQSMHSEQPLWQLL